MKNHPAAAAMRPHCILCLFPLVSPVMPCAGKAVGKGATMGQLAGRRGLAAGAAGIWRTRVERFAAEGARVVFPDILRANGETLEKSI
jgi:hypothetical protein